MKSSVIAKIISALPDILSPSQIFFTADAWQISLVILVYPVGHFMFIEPCWTKCPARSELSAGHQQKSAGHVQHISRSLKAFLISLHINTLHTCDACSVELLIGIPES